jgi:hypothetical protein
MFSLCELITISTAMMIASAPSTPAAHSSARCPEEKVRRGGGGRCPVVAGRGRRAAGVRPVGLAATRDGALDGMDAGVARPV